MKVKFENIGIDKFFIFDDKICFKTGETQAYRFGDKDSFWIVQYGTEVLPIDVDLTIHKTFKFEDNSEL